MTPLLSCGEESDVINWESKGCDIMEWNPYAFEDYRMKLQDKVRQILQIENVPLLGTGINDVVNFIAEPIPLNTHQISMDQGFNRKQLVTNHDIYMVHTVLGKKKSNESKTIGLSDQWRFTGEQSFFNNAIRSKEKGRELGKYINISPPAKKSINELDISCSGFCPNAKQLLAFKFAGLRTDAEQKRHSLYWLAIRTNPPKEFFLEDFWYYEQETGTNLSVEIAALLDEQRKQYEERADILQNWDEILEIVYKCIEENYCYIANIPAIGWKINVMKIACTTIVREITGAFDGEYGTKLLSLSEGIFRSGMFPTHRSSSAFKDDPDMQAFASAILKQKLSAAFNQILCAFTMDSFKANPFSINMASLEEFINALEQSKKVPEVSIVRGNEVLYRSKDSVNQFKGDVNACEWEALKALLSEDELSTHFQSEESAKDKICKGYEILYSRGNVLAFCDCKNTYSKYYLNEVKNFISRNKLFDHESDRLEIQQLSDTKTPQSEQDKRFIRIHQAVARAIEKSKDDIKEEKTAPST